MVSFQSSEATEYNPSASRLALQFGSGTLFGAAGVFVGGFTGYAANGFEDDLSSLAPLFLGSTVGYLMGTSSGIYIVANSNSYDASFGYILLGNIVGAGAGITGTLLIRNALNKSSLGKVSGIISLCSTIIGGMIANKMSIKKRSNQSFALLNFSNGNPQFAVPKIELTKTNHVRFNDMETRHSYSPTVKLLNISL